MSQNDPTLNVTISFYLSVWKIIGRCTVLQCDHLLFFFGQIDYKAVSDACNVYKVYPDMIDSWLSLHDVVKYFGDNYRDFQNHSKPGSFMMTSQVRLSSLLYQHRCTFSNFHHFKSSQ